MRSISISIFARAGTKDNHYNFSSLNTLSNLKGLDNVYQFYSCDINYSLQTSSVLSQLVLSMSDTVKPSNILRSGQNIEITDNNNIIFQGIILSITYSVSPSTNQSGGSFAFLTLAPSIYQLALLPMIFDNAQRTQIQSLLNIDIASFLVANNTQLVDTQKFINYLATNTDIVNIFNHKITISDLPKQVYIMAQAGQSRDSVLRSSIDYTNTVFYQQENGAPIIRQLTDKIVAPFTLLLNAGDAVVEGYLTGTVYPSVLSYEYTDNALTVPSVVNNYAIIPPNTSIASNTPLNNFVSFKPNPKYYPRVEQLQKAGWFSGQLQHSPINQNIISDTSLFAILQNYQVQTDQYMLSLSDKNTLDKKLLAYQTLIAGKTMGQSLVSYSNLECRLSLDDRVFDGVNMQFLLGKIVNITNSDMQSGLIATYSRHYSIQGSYISLCLVPIGSITGYWK